MLLFLRRERIARWLRDFAFSASRS
jgi:hypothetical protein